jgi:hypothetical protein
MKQMIDFEKYDLDHLPEEALTPEFLAGLREGHDLAEDRVSLRLAAVAIVMFAVGLLLGGLLP